MWAGRTQRDPHRPHMIVGLIGFVVAFFFLVQRPDGGGWVGPMVLLLLATFVLIYPYWHAHGNVARQWKLAQSRVEPSTIEVRDFGLVYRQPQFEIQFRWDAFRSFAETTNLVVLAYDPNEVALYIPKRAFRDTGELSDFLSILASNISASSHGFPVEPVSQKSSGGVAKLL